MSVKNYLETLLNEKKLWSGEVETEWHPKEGFFKQGAEKIANGLKNASKNLKQAMSRLNFYINRAGDNLSNEDLDRLDRAKKKLRSLYANINESKKVDDKYMHKEMDRSIQ